MKPLCQLYYLLHAPCPFSSSAWARRRSGCEGFFLVCNPNESLGAKSKPCRTKALARVFSCLGRRDISPSPQEEHTIRRVWGCPGVLSGLLRGPPSPLACRPRAALGMPLASRPRGLESMISREWLPRGHALAPRTSTASSRLRSSCVASKRALLSPLVFQLRGGCISWYRKSSSATQRPLSSLCTVPAFIAREFPPGAVG